MLRVVRTKTNQSQEVVVVENNTLIKPIEYFVFGVVVLLFLYLFLMRLTTGSFEIAVSQFIYYKFWIITLAIGFGIQLGLFKLLKIKHMSSDSTSKVAKTTGATSTATMVACCAHHAVDVLPIVGASALASVLGAYTKELFAIGIIFNLFGIGYMLKQLKGLNYGTI